MNIEKKKSDKGPQQPLSDEVANNILIEPNVEEKILPYIDSKIIDNTINISKKYKIFPYLFQILIGSLTGDFIPFAGLLLLYWNVPLNNIGPILSFSNLCSFISSFILSVLSNKLSLTGLSYIFTLYGILSSLSMLCLLFLKTIWLKFISLCIFYFMFSPLTPIMDKFTVFIVGRDNYPIYRSSASMSWGVTSSILSIFINHWTTSPDETTSLYCYTPFIFYILGISLSVIIIICSPIYCNDNMSLTHANKNISLVDRSTQDSLNIDLESQKQIEDETQNKVKPKSNTDINTNDENESRQYKIPDLKDNTYEIITLFFLTLTYGITISLLSNYFMIFLHILYQADDSIITIRQIIMIIFEVPTFILFPRISKYLSINLILTISTLLLISRCCAYLFVSNAWMLLIFESFHGILYALFWSCSLHIIYSHYNSQKLHLIFWGLYSGLGTCVGLFLGSVVSSTSAVLYVFLSLIVLNILSLSIHLCLPMLI